jgi:hypothetical protein
VVVVVGPAKTRVWIKKQFGALRFRILTVPSQDHVMVNRWFMGMWTWCRDM